MDPEKISIQDYTYDLPEERIAFHPLLKRDASKLLIYREGRLQEDSFENIDAYLPEGTALVFNDTKVINARMEFKKSSGGRIEIFCLEPYGTVTEYSSVMSKTGSVVWKCFIGGAAKWKQQLLEKSIFIDGKNVVLTAQVIEKVQHAYIVEFAWSPPFYSFAAIIEVAGDTPLPPYIKRAAGTEDTSRYQTIYAQAEGSVAAPTAGLHFTEPLLQKLAAKNIDRVFVTLHVGAGTFKPVKAATMAGHEMHSEYIDVAIGTIRQLAALKHNIAAVGTTSLRTIETLYWLGVKVIRDEHIEALSLAQWDVYNDELSGSVYTREAALHALAGWMEKNGQNRLFTKTQLLITPGYQFKMADILITNFHQPQSTLLLLVAAAIGEDWRKMYEYAMQHDFRFLSYGDGNLIFIGGR